MVEVVLAFDSRYLVGATALLSSIEFYHSTDIRVWIVDGGLQERERKVLSHRFAKLRLTWLRAELPQGLLTSGYLSSSSYLRLMLPELLPLERVIYLDTDTVLGGPLTELWELSLEGCPVGAAQCSIIHTVAHPKGLPNYQNLGLVADHPYFNAGVLLFDLARWRKDSVARQVIDYAIRNKEILLWCDQDALNAVLSHSWHPLHRRWNYIVNPWAETPAEDELLFSSGAETSPGFPNIVHFISSLKPWNEDYPHPARALYLHYAHREAKTFSQDLCGEIEQ